VERTILHRGKSAIVIAANVEALVAEAEKAKGVIEFAPQVADFIADDRVRHKVLKLHQHVELRELIVWLQLRIERALVFQSERCRVRVVKPLDKVWGLGPWVVRAHTNRYQLTSLGRRVSVLLTKTYSAFWLQD
jgi:hypothetical protein